MKTSRRRFSRGPLPFRYVLIISFVAFNISTAFGLWIINKGIEPSLISIAETKTHQIASQAINDAISKRIVENIDSKELIVIHEDSSGNGILYSLDYQVAQRVVSEATLRVQKYLDYIEAGEIDKLESFKNDVNIDYEESQKKKGIIYVIPLGMATNNTLLANLGPKVPVRFEILGSVNSEISTKFKEMRVNNAYFEIYMDITVRMNVIIPSFSKDIVVKNSIKIGDFFYPGEVPQFYNGGNGDMTPAIEPPVTN